MFYNSFRFSDVYSIILSFLIAGFCAIGYRNSKNSGWLLLIAAVFSPVIRGGYNFIENAILINYSPKPQPFFTYFDYFSRSLFVLGIARLALYKHETEGGDVISKGGIGVTPTLILGWALPSVMLILTVAVILTMLGTFYIFALIQAIGIVLPLLYVSVCMILVRIYKTKSELLRFSLQLHLIMLAVGVVMGILRRSI